MSDAVALYRRVLGEDFDKLDDAVRRLHALRGNHRVFGRCTIIGAQQRRLRWLAILLGLPAQAQDAEFSFELRVDGDSETWTRHFPQRTMRSRLYYHATGVLGERLGPAHLSFALGVHEGALSMRLLAVRVLGIRWPRRWLPDVWAREHGIADTFHFDVGARLGKSGLLVAYHGHLDLAAIETVT